MRTWDEAADLGMIECILGDSLGIYIPQEFGRRFPEWVADCPTGAADGVLEGPDGEWYWECWEEILDNASYVDSEGNRWRLYQEGDLYAIREDADIDWDAM